MSLAVPSLCAASGSHSCLVVCVVSGSHSRTTLRPVLQDHTLTDEWLIDRLKLVRAESDNLEEALEPSAVESQRDQFSRELDEPQYRSGAAYNCLECST